MPDSTPPPDEPTSTSPPKPVTCPNGHTVDAGLAFCTICGEPIGPTCPRGHQVAPADLHCGDCGAPLAPSAGPALAKGHGLRWWIIGPAFVALAAIAGLAFIVVANGDDTASVGAAPSTTTEPTTTTSTAPTTTVPPTTAPAAPVSLQPDGLGLVAFGEVANAAVDSVTEVLGPPDQDFVESTCPGGQVRFTTWGPLQMASLVDPAPTFVGYSYGSSDGTVADPPAGEALVTAEGISIGSTLGELRAAYGTEIDLIDVGFGGLYEFTVDEGPADAIRGMAPGTDDSTPIVVIYAGSQLCG